MEFGGCCGIKTRVEMPESTDPKTPMAKVRLHTYIYIHISAILGNCPTMHFNNNNNNNNNNILCNIFYYIYISGDIQRGVSKYIYIYIYTVCVVNTCTCIIRTVYGTHVCAVHVYVVHTYENH